MSSLKKLMPFESNNTYHKLLKEIYETYKFVDLFAPTESTIKK